jgi:hypothetical protein
MQRFDLKQFRHQAAGTRVLELLDFVSLVHWGRRPNRLSLARGGSGPQSLTFSAIGLPLPLRRNPGAVSASDLADRWLTSGRQNGSILGRRRQTKSNFRSRVTKPTILT